MDSYSQVTLAIENFTTSCIATIKKRAGNTSDLFEEDFLYFSAINRTIEIAEGFRDAVKAQNFSVMPVLLRVQINTLATLYFIESIEQRSEVIQEFNRGTEFRRMQIPGTKTTVHEKVLINKAKEKYPWINAVYSNTSSWVHLSPTSTYSPLEMTSEGMVTFRVPRIPDSKYQAAVDELCDCMAACLEGILTHVCNWAFSNTNLDS